jgi:hypothetical protein
MKLLVMQFSPFTRHLIPDIHILIPLGIKCIYNQNVMRIRGRILNDQDDEVMMMQMDKRCASSEIYNTVENETEIRPEGNAYSMCLIY